MGSVVAHQLIDAGHEVEILDNLSTGFAANLPPGAHLLALDAVHPGRHDIFNLGNGQGHSNRQVLDTVRAVTGVDFSVRVEGRRSGDPAVSIASSEKAHRELGWKPQRPDLADIVADAWEFHQAVVGTALGRDASIAADT